MIRLERDVDTVGGNPRDRRSTCGISKHKSNPLLLAAANLRIRLDGHVHEVGILLDAEQLEFFLRPVDQGRQNDFGPHFVLEAAQIDQRLLGVPKKHGSYRSAEETEPDRSQSRDVDVDRLISLKRRMDFHLLAQVARRMPLSTVTVNS